ncbi:MAG: hypothetical protein HYS56_01455 [Candidatus Omnitrophica bacterium]|nr:hypothetical protein [Candidatus Omnitrophota bacterium]
MILTSPNVTNAGNQLAVSKNHQQSRPVAEAQKHWAIHRFEEARAGYAKAIQEKKTVDQQVDELTAKGVSLSEAENARKAAEARVAEAKAALDQAETGYAAETDHTRQSFRAMKDAASATLPTTRQEQIEDEALVLAL